MRQIVVAQSVIPPLAPSRGSYPNVHPAAEARAAVPSPRGPAEAQGAPAEATGG